MRSQPAAHRAIHDLPATTIDRPRLLVVSDAAERMSGFGASLAIDDIAITIATSQEELQCACRDRYDVAVVDVGPVRIAEVLKTLRECNWCADVSVLVEADRLSAETYLPGLLPSYRAMPCSHPDLIKLVRWSINRPQAGERPKRLL